MEWIHNIKPISLGLLAVSAFFAWMNGLGLWHNIRHNGSVSYAPLIGFIFFFFGTLGWNAPWYFWLLALLDIGTISGFLSLPFLIEQIFSQSIFTHFATYKNQQQTIKLYKTTKTKTFYWLYTAKIPYDNVNFEPRPSGCGGDWEINGDKLILICGNKIIAIGKLMDNVLIFGEDIDPYYGLLRNTHFTKK